MHAIAETLTETETFLARTTTARNAGSRARIWSGRVLSTLAILFLAVDAIGKLLELTPYVEATARLGFAPGAVFTLGVIEAACVALYVIPRTAIVGAVLLTGWLGGAIATHVRLGSPLATHTLFPIYVAILIWGGLYLRDAWLRGILAPRRA